MSVLIGFKFMLDFISTIMLSKTIKTVKTVDTINGNYFFLV